MAARHFLLVANGVHKAEIIRRALEGPITPEVPASVLQLHPNLDTCWMKRRRSKGGYGMKDEKHLQIGPREAWYGLCVEDGVDRRSPEKADIAGPHAERNCKRRGGDFGFQRRTLLVL